MLRRPKELGWLGANLTTTAQNKALVGTLDSPGGTLLTTIGGNSYQFTCTAGELLNAILEPAGAISEANKNARADFTGCSTTVNSTLMPKCVPIDGAHKGVILTEEFYALLTLHKLSETQKDGVIVVTPKTGTVLALISFAEGCPFFEDLLVLGPLVLHDVGIALSKDECETERANHLVSEFAPLTNLTVDGGKDPASATLDGMGDIKLASGEIWSCLP